jgi:hypothetical protein
MVFREKLKTPFRINPTPTTMGKREEQQIQPIRYKEKIYKKKTDSAQSESEMKIV